MTDDLFERLRRAYCSSAMEAPPGYRSARMLAADWGTKKSKTEVLIRTGIEKGILARVDVLVNGKVVPHYGLPLKKR